MCNFANGSKLQTADCASSVERTNSVLQQLCNQSTSRVDVAGLLHSQFGYFSVNISQPVVADISQPVVADISQPVVADISQPVVADVSQPVVADVSQPVVDDVSQWLLMSVSQWLLMSVSGC
jgi:hypothetical protein